MSDKKNITETLNFNPRFGKDGLIPVIVQDIKTGKVLMFAYMNRPALDLTLKTGCAVYYSRSRKKLWKKGEQSGHIQIVKQILVDCDQDCLILKVSVAAGQCHTGRYSCFYRAVSKQNTKKLRFIAKKVFQPDKIYKQTYSL